MKTFQFVWIDDRPERLADYREVLEHGTTFARAQVELFQVRGPESLQELDQWAKERASSPPSLFIVDHIFNIALPFGINGSGVAHLLRSKLPKSPIVCVSAALDDPAAFDQEEMSEYTALFAYNELADHIEDLFAIARDFKKLHPKDSGDQHGVLDLLRAPRSERESVAAILPSEFAEKSHPTTAHRVARWLLTMFLARPGMLMDALHAATLFGLKEEAFLGVSKQFSKALYKGIFARESTPLWWGRELRRELYKVLPENGPHISQYAGRTLPGIAEHDFSVCYVTKKNDPPPMVVVNVDETAHAAKKAVRSEYAVEMGTGGLPAGFDTPLLLKRKNAN